MITKETIEDLADKAQDLWDHIKCLSTTELEDLHSETESCESEALDLSNLLDSLNNDFYEDKESVLDYIPDDLSAGEYDSLKEVLNKWRTDNGYPAK